MNPHFNRRRFRLPASALLGAFVAALVAAFVATGEISAQAAELQRGRTVPGSLASGDTVRYTIDADEGTFLLGEVNQLSVDVNIRVLGPDGAQLAALGGLGKGAERFAGRTSAAGTHTVEVFAAPRDGEDRGGAVGQFEITLLRHEPVATDPARLTDQLMARFDDEDSPGAAVRVWRDGRTLFSQSYGMANLAYGIPWYRTNGRRNMGEITKRKTGFPALHVGGIAKASRASVRASFDRAARALMGHEADGMKVPWHSRPPETLKAMRDTLAETHKPTTANASLAAVRGALKMAWIAGELDRETLERVREALGKVEGKAAPGRALTMAQISRLFGEAAKARPTTAARDAALLALLFGCGLRRAEASAADLADIEPETWKLTVHGKGKRERIAHLRNGSRDAVAEWLEARGDEPGPLLMGITKGGKLSGRRWSGAAIAAYVRRLAVEAGVPGNVAPHALRRTFATGLLEAGNDLAVVADCLGHADTSTTRLYDRRGEAAQIAAIDTLAVPFKPREG